MNMEEIQEEYKRRLIAQFERAAEKGKWLVFGGKIIIQMDPPKPGKVRIVKTAVILETTHEI